MKINEHQRKVSDTYIKSHFQTPFDANLWACVVLIVVLIVVKMLHFVVKFQLLEAKVLLVVVELKSLAAKMLLSVVKMLLIVAKIRWQNSKIIKIIKIIKLLDY